MAPRNECRTVNDRKILIDCIFYSANKIAEEDNQTADYDPERNQSEYSLDGKVGEYSFFSYPRLLAAVPEQTGKSDGRVEASFNRNLSPENQIRLLEEAGSLKDGYLVFQSLLPENSGGSLGINLAKVFNAAMDSPVNHVGILRWVNGRWRVVEATADGVRYIRLTDFIERNPNAYWIKRFDSVDATPEARERFVQTAHRYFNIPYDFYFEEGADKIYCSELVDLAALGAGYSLVGLKIPARWLNSLDTAIQTYLFVTRQTSDVNKLPADWHLLPPHALFYSNYLTDPPLPIGFNNGPNIPIPKNMLYDTIPGSTPSEKLSYIVREWSKYRQDIKISTTQTMVGQERVTNYNFHFLDGGKHPIQHSLTLFGHFKEEGSFAYELIGELFQCTPK